MGLRYFLLRRIIAAVFAVLAVMTLTFAIFKLIPGNQLVVILGDPRRATNQKVVEEVTKFYGLDQPVYIQYLTYMNNFLHGNLGFSSSTASTINSNLAVFFPATIELTIFAIIIAVGIAIPVGIVSATRRGSVVDHTGRVISILGVSAPSFWWGTLFLVVFYLFLGLVGPGRLSAQLTPPPFVTGFETVDSLLALNLTDFVDALKHLILPALALGMVGNATMMRLTRSSMLEVLNSDYIAMARMKGVRERIVIYKHAFRNAIIPTFTYAGLLFGGMLGGSVLVETVFIWPGMGRYITGAIFASDLQAVVATTFVMALVFTIVNLVVDVMYGILDPRVRVE